MAGEKRKKRAVKISLIAMACAVAGYVLICLFITLGCLFDMLIQNKSSRNVALGKARYAQIQEEGISASYDIYSEEEVPKNPDLKVVKLYYFPAKSGEKTDFALVLPGGGYYECDVYKVAFPCAATLNGAGYSAFVLAYRCGKYSSEYAPLDDLARAVAYITDNAQKFNINTENYAVVGYSAGGNLAGLFGSKSLGYAKYSLPKPTALILAYPWININGKVGVTGNMWQDIVAAVSRNMGNKYLLGKSFPDGEKKQSVCVQNQVDADYPPTFIMHGDKDFVIPHRKNSLVMADALKANGVRYKLKLCKGVNHGCGLGEGTSAAGWVEEAIAFWQLGT